jgi:hypothetical protein
MKGDNMAKISLSVDHSPLIGETVRVRDGAGEYIAVGEIVAVAFNPNGGKENVDSKEQPLGRFVFLVREHDDSSFLTVDAEDCKLEPDS